MPLPPMLEEHGTVQFPINTHLNRSDAAVTPFVFQPYNSQQQSPGTGIKSINFMGFE